MFLSVNFSTSFPISGFRVSFSLGWATSLERVSTVESQSSKKFSKTFYK